MGFDIIQTDWPYLLSSYIKINKIKENLYEQNIEKLALLSVCDTWAVCAPSIFFIWKFTSIFWIIGSSDEKSLFTQTPVSNGRGDWLKEKAAENGFNIEFVSINGGELADRVIAEKKAMPIADMDFRLNKYGI